ncbi:hypothetical protein D9758_018577 [Tetrapyrgos nigripes]|uniref:Uncharacterized protein n=1 Tax=Tetrapyrgos nigripes TaxID=182062 RepID=A0A8H5B133_9AGAR|nr:hypothetical protein D9758_018577 [Tetrapyrgos nigripes]
MAPGFRIIYSASGKEGFLDEFLDRYNNKHVPVRLHHLKSFLSGVRHSVPTPKLLHGRSLQY